LVLIPINCLIDHRMIMVESLHRPWHLPSLKLAQLARWEESLFAAYVTISIKKEKTTQAV